MNAHKTFYWNRSGLTGMGVQPANEAIKKMVVLLHGYMGDAESNMAFASKICTACPHTVVLVPDGPELVPTENDSKHRQWYPLPETEDYDGCLYSCMPY